MAYLKNDVHDLNSNELGNLIFTTLNDRDVITIEVRSMQRRRTMRIWYEDDDGSGDPIDPDELQNEL